MFIPSDLTVDQTANALKRRIRDARQFRQLGKDEVQVLETFPQKCEARLRAALMKQPRDIGIGDVVRTQEVLYVLVEALLVDPVLAREMSAQLSDPMNERWPLKLPPVQVTKCRSPALSAWIKSRRV